MRDGVGAGALALALGTGAGLADESPLGAAHKRAVSVQV